MYVIREGLGPRWHWLAMCFAVAGLIGCLPAFQTNQLVQILRDVLFIDNGWLAVDTDPFVFNLAAGALLAMITAAVIFGGWTLKGTVAGCIVFAGALSFRLSLQVLGYDQVNSEFLQALPFLVTIFGMAIFATRVRPPAALARPFIRGLK